MCPGYLFSLYYKNICIFLPACRRAGYSRPPGRLAPEESCKPGGRASFRTKCGKKGGLCYYQKKAGQLTCFFLVVAETGFDCLFSTSLNALFSILIKFEKRLFCMILSLICQFTELRIFLFSIIFRKMWVCFV